LRGSDRFPAGGIPQFLPLLQEAVVPLARDRQYVEPALLQHLDRAQRHGAALGVDALHIGVSGQQVGGSRLGLRLIPVASGVRYDLDALGLQCRTGRACTARVIRRAGDAVEHEDLVTAGQHTGKPFSADLAELGGAGVDDDVVFALHGVVEGHDLNARLLGPLNHTTQGGRARRINEDQVRAGSDHVVDLRDLLIDRLVRIGDDGAGDVVGELVLCRVLELGDHLRTPGVAGPAVGEADDEFAIDRRHHVVGARGRC